MFFIERQGYSRWLDTTTTTTESKSQHEEKMPARAKNGDDLQAWRNLMLMNVVYTPMCVVLKRKTSNYTLQSSFLLNMCTIFYDVIHSSTYEKKWFSPNIACHPIIFPSHHCVSCYFISQNSPIFRNHNCVIAALLGQRLLPGCQLLLKYFVEIWSTLVLIKSLIDVSWDDNTSSICRGGILLGSSNSIVSNKTKLEHCVHFNFNQTWQP